MSTGVSCLVYIDGTRAADGQPTDNWADPVILSDLAVTWGRSDTMSQPAPDSCTFSVMDQVGGQAFIAQYRTGRRVDVYARGNAYADASIPTFTNPGFEDAALTWLAQMGTATRQGARVHSGSYALRVDPAPGDDTATVVLAPAPFQPAGTNPDAWDAIPTTEAGQQWTISVAVWLPVGSTVRTRAVTFTGPYQDAGTPAGVEHITDGAGAWQVISTQHVIQTGNRWIGLQLTFSPTGPAWQDIPTADLWSTLDPALTWLDYGSLYVDDAQVTSPAEGELGRSVLVFSGRITDLSAQWDDSTGSPVVEVTASGFTADLDNRAIGDEPWTVETVAVRATRILTLAGLPITIDIDTSLDAILLSYRDIDSQGATGLLQEIATSVDGVLWPAVHSSLGAYLRLEDPALRVPLLKLAELAGPAPIVQRTNLARNPRGVAPNVFGEYGNRWAWLGSYTTGIVGHPEGITTAYRTTAPAAPSQGNGRGLDLYGNFDTATFPTTLPVSPGVPVTLSTWVRTGRARNVYFNMRTHDGAAWVGAASAGTPAPTGAGAWTRFTRTYTPPAGAAYLTARIQILESDHVEGDYLESSGLLIEWAPAMGTYFDGSTPDTATQDHAWTAAVNGSTSTQSTIQTTTIVIVQTDPDAGIDLSACVILRDPVSWIQDVSDVVTRVAVGWQVQGVDDEGMPTTSEATYHTIDAPLEAEVGTRAVSVSTQLQAEADAIDVGARILARTSPTGWRADGLTINDDDVANTTEGISTLLYLLDGTARIGTPLVIGDLPEWSPAGSAAGVYLEGGTYTFAEGRWILELLVSAATGIGQSVTWLELDPAWMWNQWEPSISWADLRGVAPAE